MAASPYLTTFAEEAADLLEVIEATVLALEAAPGDRELIDQLFRAFHTLKGSGGVAGLTELARFTHHVESAMDRVRSGALALTPALATVVLAAKDHIAALLGAALGRGAVDAASGAALEAQLAAMIDGAPIAPPAPVAPPVAPPPPAAPAPAAPRRLYEFALAFTAHPDAAEPVDASGFEAELARLGELTVSAPLPQWAATLVTHAEVDAVQDAFIFVANLGTPVVELASCLFFDAPVADDDAPVAAPTSAAVEAAPVAAGPRAPAKDAVVRVSSERLDQLVKLIGELVITQSRLAQAHALHPTPELAPPVEAMDRLIADLRDGVLGLRMVPIGSQFTRFQRLVRDLSAELGKDVELVTSGDDTELDKSVIDQLTDALVHVVRNAMDHGLEAPAARLAAGKPARGTLRLAAVQEGTHVVITIADDGRGIDPVAVRAKAEARGLIAPGETLSERDLLGLIIRPGFSTVTQVTELSGRGVGMDVVKRTVEGLRGTLAISSQVGLGTEIRLRLPLNLAIIDGLRVDIHGDPFIVPMAAVTENLELSAAERHAHNGRNLVPVRGELVPYIRLRELFGHGDDGDAVERVVVVAVDGHRVGLVVDRVLGSHQTVIQPLGRLYRDVELFSGTTILGDGRVAMILDLAGTVRSADRSSGSLH